MSGNTSGREVITLQFGNYANYVGAQFWNIEDELAVLDSQQAASNKDSAAATHSDDESKDLDPEILVKSCTRLTESARHKGQLVYTPRVVCYDMTGSFGTVSGRGTLQLPPELDNKGRPPLPPTWTGKVKFCADDTIPKNRFLASLEEDNEDDDDEQKSSDPYASMFGSDQNALSDNPFFSSQSSSSPSKTQSQNTQQAAPRPKVEELELDKNVRYWTDYLKVHLEDKNLYELPAHHHNVTPFDHFAAGMSLYDSDIDISDDMVDKIRILAEECDRVDGFQGLVDVASGFSGMAVRILEYVGEEYPSAPVVCHSYVPYQRPLRADQARWRAANAALAHSDLSRVSALYIPQSVQHWTDKFFQPDLHLDVDKRFHTASVLGATLHSATLPYRRSSNMFSMRDYAQQLVTSPALNTVAISTCIPFSSQLDSTLAAFIVGGQPGKDAAELAATMPLYTLRFMKRVSSISPVASTQQQQQRKRLLSEYVILRGAGQSHTPKLDQAWLKHHPSGQHVQRKGVRVLAPLQQYLRASPAFSQETCLIEQPLPIPVPFPQFFSSDVVQRFGTPISTPGDPAKVDELAAAADLPPPLRVEVEQLPSLTHLYASAPELKNHCLKHLNYLQHMSATSRHACGLDKDDVEQAGVRLNEHVDEYTRVATEN